MRPPQNAGEDEVLPDVDGDSLEASMRPPQNAGEDGAQGASGGPVFIKLQ